MTQFTGLRQERPPHLRPDAMHPAMREKGRAIPSTQTVPIVEKATPAASAPRIVEGRVSNLLLTVSKDVITPTRIKVSSPICAQPQSAPNVAPLDRVMFAKSIFGFGCL